MGEILSAFRSSFFGRGTVLLGLMVGVVGCSDVRLGLIPESNDINAQSEGQFCISPPEKVGAYTKFLFVMDKSGSNSETDPGARKRASNLEHFVARNQNNPYYQFGMIIFQEDRAEAYINDGSLRNPIFTKDPKKIEVALKQLRKGDHGTTPYRAALELSEQAIIDDIQKYPSERSNYMVFFISDGAPTDETSVSRLRFLVEQLVSTGGREIHLSTGFYGPNGRKAKDLLAEMADAGGGKFIDFEEGSHWNFEGLVVEPTLEPWQLKEFVIYNLNAGFCLDGEVAVDSDADGMCDKDELQANQDFAGELGGRRFDPGDRFSFSDGYGDYFHWLRYQLRSPGGDEFTLPQCHDRSDEDHDLLTPCEEKVIFNQNPGGSISQTGDPAAFDTDQDGLLDGIETFVFFPKTRAYAMDAGNLRQVFDGEDEAGIQIKQHRNPLIKDPWNKSYDTDVQRLLTPQAECYSVRQPSLPLYPSLEVPEGKSLKGLSHGANQNVILVYYIQAPQSDPGQEGVLNFSLQTLGAHRIWQESAGPQAGLVLRDNVFRSYRPQK